MNPDTPTVSRRGNVSGTGKDKNITALGTAQDEWHFTGNVSAQGKSSEKDGSSETRQQKREQAMVDFGTGLAAVSQSPDGRWICVGGREVLSLVSLEHITSKGGQFSDVFDVRRSNSKNKYHIQDVRWHPKSLDLIASAASNGTLVLWNVTAAREGGDSKVVVWESKDHTRTVWRLAWCEPVGNETLMLSGSLDGTIRLWDFRVRDTARSVMTMSKHQQQSAVRDLRVCGGEPWKLAAGLECGNEGAVVLWDVRKTDSHVRRLGLHLDRYIHAQDALTQENGMRSYRAIFPPCMCSSPHFVN
jgi:WD40 repeat protein